MYLSVITYNPIGDIIRKNKLTKGEDFTTVTLPSGKRGLKLLREIVMFVNGTTLIFKEGHTWNGASIPRIFWWVIGKPTDPEFALASLFHDEMYRLRLDRDLADTIFRKLLDRAGVNGRKTALMWAAVRVGGHTFYAASADNNKLSTRVWRLVLKLM